MKRALSILILSLIIAPSVHANDSAAEMQERLSTQLANAEIERDGYHAGRIAGTDDELAQELLIKAERSWKSFMVNECKRIADGERGGTLSSIMYLQCAVKMTKARRDLHKNEQ